MSSYYFKFGRNRFIASFALICLLILLVCSQSSIASEHKQTRHAKLTSAQSTLRITSIAQLFSKPSSRSSTQATSSSNTPKRPNVIATIAKTIAKNVRDEVADCYDSVVYAESNSERIEACKDILRRHQGGIALVGVGLLVTTLTGRKRGKSIALETIKKMREEEAIKWGTRLTGM